MKADDRAWMSDQGDMAVSLNASTNGLRGPAQKSRSDMQK